MSSVNPSGFCFIFTSKTSRPFSRKVRFSTSSMRLNEASAPSEKSCSREKSRSTEARELSRWIRAIAFPPLRTKSSSNWSSENMAWTAKLLILSSNAFGSTASDFLLFFTMVS